MGLSIGNRRYTGSKKALLTDIYSCIPVEYFKKRKIVFADLFAGTGIVSLFMLEKGMNVIVNDTLLSNNVAYHAWLGSGAFDIKKVQKYVTKFNKITSSTLKDNYFSKVYGGKYFSFSDAKKIGFIRDAISKLKLTERERSILLVSLMYSADKIANTVGHFEHYLAQKPKEKGLILQVPDIQKFSAKAEIYRMDANQLAKSITCDIAYIDPPYNARQYVNFYHVLENLVTWDKPMEFEGTSMKFKRNHLKSDYSKSKAPIVFEALIKDLKAKIIIVSYNNTYTARSNASNNKISEKDILKILSAKGKVTIKEFMHKSFNSGKTDFKNHKEILYICNSNL